MKTVALTGAGAAVIGALSVFALNLSASAAPSDELLSLCKSDDRNLPQWCECLDEDATDASIRKILITSFENGQYVQDPDANEIVQACREKTKVA